MERGPKHVEEGL